MIKTMIVTLVVGVIIFEVLEHLILPLVWVLMRRRTPPRIGTESMLGKVVEVREWKGHEGKVTVNGELWNAVCDVPIMAGYKATIESIRGLVLQIKPLVDHSSPGSTGPCQGPKEDGTKNSIAAGR